MDKDQKEIELKKLEIEKLKIKESLFRTLILIVLTAGAGIGAVIYQIKFDFFMKYMDLFNFIFVIFLGGLTFTISIVAYFLWRNIKNKLKEL